MRPSGTKRGKIARAYVSGGRTLLDVALLSGEHRSAVELLMPYGITAIPGEGADVIVHEVGGDRGHLVAQAADEATLRVTGLAAGSWAVQDARGQMIVLGEDGVRVVAALSVTIESVGEILLEGPTIRLGAGATKQVKLADNSSATKVFAE